MGLPKRYDPGTVESRLQASWQEAGVFHFSPEAEGPVYSIDTPPSTVSGHLHLGHVYSYSHADFIARFWRMNGYNVFYPMGYDDNGLPTERLVERRLGVTAPEVGRRALIEKCLEVSEEAEQEYERLWKRLGLSIDWRYTYRTIDEFSRYTSQFSFLDLVHRGLAYPREAPAIWCPECRTAIAQAELNDLERESEFVTLAFQLENGEVLPIATTRPELLPACVAVFVHPNDARFSGLVGQSVTVPLFGQTVPLLADPGADPEKGSGAVMGCTFGDTADVEWWYTHKLPLRAIIGRDGRLIAEAGEFAGLSVSEARRQIVATLDEQSLVLGRRPVPQSVRVHERCDTPVEYVVTQQWFIRVLDFKAALLAAGEQVAWHPAHMKARYREWVENLHWDWCISRQRYFGVPFPVWYCDRCGEVILADEQQLPVDPTDQQPARPCACGGTTFRPEEDVMDTWATSSLSPQIVGRWLEGRSRRQTSEVSEDFGSLQSHVPGDNSTDVPDTHDAPRRGAPPKGLYTRVFPMSLRPQAHEIIRTWAFYTIVKSHHHFGAVPWKNVLISGWGLAGEGMGKISKSRGGGPMAPLEMIKRYSADAVRYWAASTGPGKDSVISEEKIQVGVKLVTKLWNVARFAERFVEEYHPPAEPPALSPADRWILSRTQRLIRRTTELFQAYDYAAAKSEMETFFWRDLADNYLEMAKQRLYDEASMTHEGARYTLHHVLLTTVKLLAPFLPHVTEEIYRGLFAPVDGRDSIHLASWPVAAQQLVDDQADAIGETLVEVATAARRYKSERGLSLGVELERLQLATSEPALAAGVQAAEADLMSITRAQRVEVVETLDLDLEVVNVDGPLAAAIAQQ
ncbi:MAG: valine--tRNA ligase [Ardenticatenaceae bacterium]|nr:valine--tRNA ligase [Ardenticatenaceae bacterium]